MESTKINNQDDYLIDCALFFVFLGWVFASVVGLLFLDRAVTYSDSFPTDYLIVMCSLGMIYGQIGMLCSVYSIYRDSHSNQSIKTTF